MQRIGKLRRGSNATDTAELIQQKALRVAEDYRGTDRSLLYTPKETDTQTIRKIAEVCWEINEVNNEVEIFIKTRKSQKNSAQKTRTQDKNNVKQSVRNRQTQGALTISTEGHSTPKHSSD